MFFDYMAQPILGTFTLNLGQILTSTRGIDTVTEARLKKFNEQISQAISGKKNDRTKKMGDFVS